MRIIPRPFHALLDYLVGALLIALPWILGFADGTAATSAPVIAGVAALLYSLITDYELSAVRLLPFKIHLGLDVLSGVLLACSPWLFGFADRIALPHVIAGLFEVFAGLATRLETPLPAHADAKYASVIPNTPLK